jgi:hypothetical protein
MGFLQDAHCFMNLISIHLQPERVPKILRVAHNIIKTCHGRLSKGGMPDSVSLFRSQKDIPDKPFLRRASWATAPLGVLAFWSGMLMAALRYPSEYDWRYMPVSNLLSPSRDPGGYLWASTGIVLCSLCGLCWAAVMAQRWNHKGAGDRPSGIRALQFGNFCMMCAAVLPQWMLPVQKGHEILAVLAFAGLCIGMIRLMFQTIKRILLRRMLRFIGQAQLYAGILASVAVLPILLAGLAQVYVHYVLPELPWVNLSWRARGVPVYLSLAFWEWITCVALSAYMTILSLAIPAVYPTHKVGKGS